MIFYKHINKEKLIFISDDDRYRQLSFGYGYNSKFNGYPYPLVDFYEKENYKVIEDKYIHIKECRYITGELYTLLNYVPNFKISRSGKTISIEGLYNLPNKLSGNTKFIIIIGERSTSLLDERKCYLLFENFNRIFRIYCYTRMNSKNLTLWYSSDKFTSLIKKGIKFKNL